MPGIEGEGFPKQSLGCGGVLTYSPNKGGATEVGFLLIPQTKGGTTEGGFLLIFYRSTFVHQDFPSPPGYLGYLRVPKPSCQ